VAVNRRLLHVPIIHTQADMGALGEAFKRAVINQLGERKWQLKADLVEQVWTAIEQALAGLNLRYELVRIYQDGLPVCGHELRIVNELARAGSRNHRLLLRMHQRGATLMGTESAELLVEEYQLAKQLLANSKAPQARSGAEQNLARALLKFTARQAGPRHRADQPVHRSGRRVTRLKKTRTLKRQARKGEYLELDKRVAYPKYRAARQAEGYSRYRFL
jgi:hypothetical protein